MGDVLLIIFMALTTLALLWGLFGVLRGADPSKQNKAMTWRVGFQAVCLVILGVLFSMGK